MAKLSVDIRIYPLREKQVGKVAAFVSIMFQNAVVVNNFKIVRYNDGFFVASPQIKVNGDYVDIAYMANKTIKEAVDGKILSKWEKMLSEDKELNEMVIKKSEGKKASYVDSDDDGFIEIDDGNDENPFN